MSNNPSVFRPGPTPKKMLAPNEPPMFDVQGDFQKYRKDFSRWVQTI